MPDQKQIEIISLEELVPAESAYRKFEKLFNFEKIEYRLKKLEKNLGRTGYGICRLFKCLLYQFMEDLSDRELEMSLKTNNVSKWFCGFGLKEKVPVHSLFGQIRTKIGTDRLSKLFSIMRNQLRESGYMSEVFTFVDASHLITKANLWKERDEAIKQKYEKLNNNVLPKVARDKQARIGCKGKDKFWYGFKKHVSVDMQSGMINKVAVTPANVIDAQGLKHVCPNQGAVYGDKGYCTSPAKKAAAKKGVHLAAIKNNNMKDKDKDKDKWYSKIRSPYERTFSKANHRVRYSGVAKNQFAEFMHAMCFNLRRLVSISPPLNQIP
jgi:transposase, IS5 family